MTALDWVKRSGNAALREALERRKIPL